MARTLTIEIKSTEDALQDFRKTFKALETGRRVVRHEGVYFTSIESARNLLTRNRLALLRAILREASPIDQRAGQDREAGSQAQDPRILEEYG